MRIVLAAWLALGCASAQGIAIYGFQTGSVFNSCALSAATHQCFAAFITHKPLIVTGVKVRVGTVTAGDTVRVSLQTMSGAYPSGTILGSGTVAVGTGNANSFVQVAFGGAVHLERVQRVAIVADFPAYSSGNLNMTLSSHTNGYIGLHDALHGVVTSGRFDGSVWSQYQRTTALGVVLLGEVGAPIQMYWAPSNTASSGLYGLNTTRSAVCVARSAIRVDGLMVSRTTDANYSPYVTLSIARGGTTAWQTQWTDGRSENSTFTVVPVTPPVVVGAGETFTIREQGSGYVQGYLIDDAQPDGAYLRETTASLLACRPESGTRVLAAFPLVTLLPMRQGTEVEW